MPTQYHRVTELAVLAGAYAAGVGLFYVAWKPPADPTFHTRSAYISDV
jgi:hypothetical protein